MNSKGHVKFSDFIFESVKWVYCLYAKAVKIENFIFESVNVQITFKVIKSNTTVVQQGVPYHNDRLKTSNDSDGISMK